MSDVTDMEKAKMLLSAGWKPAGEDGPGPFGETEWWPPFNLDVPFLTASLNEAYKVLTKDT